MQDVYGSSYLSLAAVSADNSAQGLYRKRSAEAVRPSVVRVKLSHQTLDCYVVREDFWKGEILSQPLYKRGWVLQERMLAPRILHFNRRQVLWQCPSLTASEGLPKGLSNMITDQRDDETRWRRLVHREEKTFNEDEEAAMHHIWKSLVNSYTTCNLTKSGDMLMAISGIAKRMQQAYKNEKYIAGHWERRLVDQLAWHVVDSKPPTSDLSYRAPSWAWPSADGVVEVPARLRIPHEFEMKVCEGGLQLVHMNPDSKLDVGTLSFASLTVETELYKMHFVPSAGDPLQLKWVSIEEDSSDVRCRLHLDRPLELKETELGEQKSDDTSAITSDHSKPMQCLAAMLFYGRDNEVRSRLGAALALRYMRVGQAFVYHRIGLIRFRGLDDDGWQTLRKERQSKDPEAKKAQEVAPSDNRGEYSHIITIL